MFRRQVLKDTVISVKSDEDTLTQVTLASLSLRLKKLIACVHCCSFQTSTGVYTYILLHASTKGTYLASSLTMC